MSNPGAKYNIVPIGVGTNDFAPRYPGAPSPPGATIHARGEPIDAAFATAAPNTGWGMTETNAIGVGISGADYLKRPTSSGRVSAVLDVKVVDEAGNTLPAGKIVKRLLRDEAVRASGVG